MTCRSTWGRLARGGQPSAHAPGLSACPAGRARSRDPRRVGPGLAELKQPAAAATAFELSFLQLTPPSASITCWVCPARPPVTGPALSPPYQGELSSAPQPVHKPGVRRASAPRPCSPERELPCITNRSTGRQPPVVTPCSLSGPHRPGWWCRRSSTTRLTPAPPASRIAGPQLAVASGIASELSPGRAGHLSAWCCNDFKPVSASLARQMATLALSPIPITFLNVPNEAPP